MAVLSTNVEITGRFAPYLQELSETFAMHGVGSGTPADLHGVVERLHAGGGFAEDVSSILRSIILRQGGSIPQTELLEVIALAAGGPELDPTQAAVQPSFRRLLSFVGSVTRRPWNEPPGEFTGSGIAASPALLSEPGEWEAASGLTPLERVTASPAAAPALQREPMPLSMSVSRARMLDEDSEPPVGGFPPPKPHKDHDPSWPLWIAAACATLAVLGLLTFDRLRSSSQPLPAGANAVAAATAATVPGDSPASVPVGQLSAQQPAKPSAGAPPSAGRRPVTSGLPPAVGTVTPPAQESAAGQVADARHSVAAEAAGTEVAAAVASAATHERAEPAVETANVAGETPAASPASRRASIALPRTSNTHGAYFQVSSGVMASHLLHAAEPGYPMLARLTHLEGQVMLQAVISTEGQVVATHILSGHHLLRGAAADAVKRWKYRPYFVDGRPVNVATIVTVDFHERR